MTSTLPDSIHWTDKVAALAALATALIAAAAVVFAWRQVREARRLREEQAAPYVVVSADNDRGGARVFPLLVKNFGLTAAVNVWVRFPDGFFLHMADGGTRWCNHLSDVIQTLVPGQELVFWGTWNDQPDEFGTLRMPVEVSYERLGDRRKKKIEVKYVVEARNFIPGAHGPSFDC